jgi:RNA polymerase sigma-70 factor (ECF subfamily)
MNGDDAALLTEIAAGSERAFNTLIDRHQQALRAFLRAFVNDPSDADDVAQETFLAVWRNAGVFRGRSSVRSWLFAIAWRRVKDAQRSRFRRLARETAQDGPAPLERDEAALTLERLAIERALADLPADQRAAVSLCLAWGLTHDEAAAALELPLGTVKSHVARGRARLLAALREPS